MTARVVETLRNHAAYERSPDRLVICYPAERADEVRERSARPFELAARLIEAAVEWRADMNNTTASDLFAAIDAITQQEARNP